MYCVKYSARVHIAKDARACELASASPPYERVPNISQYTLNNLFIMAVLLYTFHIDLLVSSVLST